MRVVTFNCAGLPLLTGAIARRLAQAGTRLAALDADVVLVQEVFLNVHLAALRRALPGHRALAAPLRPLRVAGGIAAFTRRPPAAWSFTPYAQQGPPRGYSVWARLVPRGWMELELGALRVVHTHLAANYRSSADPDSRDPANPYRAVQEAQLGELAARLRALRARGPLVVGGDLNLRPGAPLLRAFLEECGLVDAMAGSREPSVRDGAFHRIPHHPAPAKRIDYLLGAGARPSAARYALRDGGLSDHFAVVADFLYSD